MLSSTKGYPLLCDRVLVLSLSCVSCVVIQLADVFYGFSWIILSLFCYFVLSFCCFMLPIVFFVSLYYFIFLLLSIVFFVSLYCLFSYFVLSFLIFYIVFILTSYCCFILCFCYFVLSVLYRSIQWLNVICMVENFKDFFWSASHIFHWLGYGYFFLSVHCVQVPL